MARRNPADGAALDPALTQKKRARRRLVGAVTLGVIAALVLPLVLDSEPRQTISDVEIEIPPREAALPEVDLPKPEDAAVASSGVEEIVVPPSPSEPIAQPTPPDPKAVARADPEPTPPAEAPAGASESAARPQSAAKVPAQSQSRTPAAAPKAAPVETPKAASAEATKSAPAAATKPASEAPKVATAPARAESAAASGTGYALQVGAFANAGSARAQLDKARRTGLRAYTEKVKTAQGERTRVRVGPFSTREEAEKARATLKRAGMESAVVDAGAARAPR